MYLNIICCTDFTSIHIGSCHKTSDDNDKHDKAVPRDQMLHTVSSLNNWRTNKSIVINTDAL